MPQQSNQAYSLYALLTGFQAAAKIKSKEGSFDIQDPASETVYSIKATSDRGIAGDLAITSDRHKEGKRSETFEQHLIDALKAYSHTICKRQNLPVDPKRNITLDTNQAHPTRLTSQRRRASGGTGRSSDGRSHG